jgi:hypothetical protein
MAWPTRSDPKGTHAVFYSYAIVVGSTAIGSIERVSMRATRATERIREVLQSQGPIVKEIVWGGTDITLDCSRVELYDASIVQAFGSGVTTIEIFNSRVDIMEQRWKGENSDNIRTVAYYGCVASDWGKEIDTGTARVVETMTFQVRYMEVSEGSAGAG